MATPPVRQWGVTPPISTVLPTKDELSANDDLIAELKAQNNFELPTETERRCVRISTRIASEPRTDKCGIGNKCSSYYNALQWNLFKSSVARRVCPLLLLRLLGVKFLPTEVTG